jgi:hypothetical protein
MHTLIIMTLTRTLNVLHVELDRWLTQSVRVEIDAFVVAWLCWKHET